MLGNVKEVIYLQDDDGMFRIGNILRNLTACCGDCDRRRRSWPLAPQPIAAGTFGLGYYKALNAAYSSFASATRKTPFFVDQYGQPRDSRSISTFLCTATARDIYKLAAGDFAGLGGDGLCHPENERHLGKARRFLHYATNSGRRGTVHGH